MYICRFFHSLGRLFCKPVVAFHKKRRNVSEMKLHVYSLVDDPSISFQLVQSFVILPCIKPDHLPAGSFFRILVHHFLPFSFLFSQICFTCSYLAPLPVYQAAISFPQRRPAAIPALKNGPKGMDSFPVILLVNTRGVSTIPHSKTAIPPAAIILIAPKKAPPAAASLISPPPKAPGRTIVMAVIGRLIHKSPAILSGRAIPPLHISAAASKIIAAGMPSGISLFSTSPKETHKRRLRKTPSSNFSVIKFQQCFHRSHYLSPLTLPPSFHILRIIPSLPLHMLPASLLYGYA